MTQWGNTTPKVSVSEKFVFILRHAPLRRDDLTGGHRTVKVIAEFSFAISTKLGDLFSYTGVPAELYLTLLKVIYPAKICSAGALVFIKCPASYYFTHLQNTQEHPRDTTGSWCWYVALSAHGITIYFYTTRIEMFVELTSSGEAN